MWVGFDCGVGICGGLRSGGGGGGWASAACRAAWVVGVLEDPVKVAVRCAAPYIIVQCMYLTSGLGAYFEACVATDARELSYAYRATHAMWRDVVAPAAAVAAAAFTRLRVKCVRLQPVLRGM